MSMSGDTLKVCVNGQWISLLAIPGVQPTPFSMVMANHIVRSPGMTLGVDAGAGGGILSLVMAHRGFERVIAVEINEKACEILEENVSGNGLAGVIEIRHADIRDVTIAEDVDVVVSNPPTLPVTRPDLPWFLHGAGEDGLEFLRALTRVCEGWLSKWGEMQIVLSSLVNMEAFNNMLLKEQLELTAVSTYLLPFREFYWKVFEKEQIRKFERQQKVVIEKEDGRIEASEFVTGYRGRRSVAQKVLPAIRTGQCERSQGQPDDGAVALLAPFEEARTLVESLNQSRRSTGS